MKHSQVTTGLFTTAALALCVSTQANILQVDINEVGSSNTQSGFDALTLNSGGTNAMTDTFNGITVDVDGFGFSLNGGVDRTRSAPVDNPPALTESAIYQDFVFAFGNGTPGSSGLDATVSGLSANTWYRTEVWSFDASSSGNRPSDWSTTGGNGTVLVADNYDFNGGVLPTTNTEGKFNFWVQTDGSGQFTLSGRNSVSQATNAGAVFLNGLAITHRAQGDKVYRIDLNSTVGDGGPIENMPGWTSLDASGADPNTATVTVDGITFQPFSADSNGSRVRRNGGGDIEPNLLNGDFVFDDGAGQAVGLFFGDAGDLQAGTWLVEMYIWDQDTALDDMIVGLRRNNAETIIDMQVRPVDDGAAITFTFESDGIGRYDVFVRDAEGGATNTRLNAVTLALVPEPSSLALLGLGGLMIARRRR